MKYFVVRYTNELPDQFGGLASGPLIKIRPKYASDQGLLEHEKVHVRQWYGGLLLVAALALVLAVGVAVPCGGLAVFAPFAHGLTYKYCRRYRLWCEVRAYRQQLALGAVVSHEFAVTALVQKYDLHLDRQEATALLSR